MIHVQMENLHLAAGHSTTPGGEILTILADGNDFRSCIMEGVLTANQMEGTQTKDADGNLLNPEREAVETQTGMDVFPVTTCPSLFADLEAEGVCAKNATTGFWDCVDGVLKYCRHKTDGDGNELPDIEGCNRISRLTSHKTKFWSDDDPPKMLGTIGITSDE